jgi:hypothetical protein
MPASLLHGKLNCDQPEIICRRPTTTSHAPHPSV